MNRKLKQLTRIPKHTIVLDMSYSTHQQHSTNTLKCVPSKSDCMAPWLGQLLLLDN
jgi:hypothetical protein